MRKFVLAAVLFCVAGAAQAATLNVDAGGQLVGASGVNVGGALFNVEFQVGTCVNLYNGCDETSDFTFQSDADALVAAHALLDQVFIDAPEGNFDSFPFLTNGCTLNPTALCGAITPYGIVLDPPIEANFPLGLFPVLASIALNCPLGVGCAGQSLNTDRAGLLLYGSGFYNLTDISQNENYVFTRWSLSPIPEPNTALLLSLGLTGLSWKGRRSLRS